MKTLITTEELAKLFNVSKRTIYRMAENKKLPLVDKMQ